MSEIIVTAHYPTISPGISPTTYTSATYSGATEVPSYDSAQNTDPNQVSVSVRVSVSNAINSAKAQEAAQNIGEAVAIIINAAKSLPANTPIPLPNGKATTAGQLLSDVKNTKFIVTDNPNFGNRGVGGADHPSMTDTLHFASFVEGAGISSYTNAQWLGQGMTGIMLHELGHLSVAGYANFNEENAKYNTEFRKHGTGIRDFYSSDYHPDDERFQHQYAISAADVLGIDFNKYNELAPYNSGFVGADAIYMQHVEDNNWDS